jgi:hypothetical protein
MNDLHHPWKNWHIISLFQLYMPYPICISLYHRNISVHSSIFLPTHWLMYGGSFSFFILFDSAIKQTLSTFSSPCTSILWLGQETKFDSRWEVGYFLYHHAPTNLPRFMFIVNWEFFLRAWSWLLFAILVVLWSFSSPVIHLECVASQQRAKLSSFFPSHFT